MAELPRFRRTAGPSTFVAWSPPDGSAVRRLEAALQRWYAPVLGDTSVTSAWYGDVSVTFVQEGDEERFDGGPFLWGGAWGTTGSATDAELSTALAEPRRALDLLGSFVVGDEVDGHLRLVTSADLASPLRVASGPAGRAVGTRGVPALLAVDRSLEIDPRVVPEFILFDYVHGDEELLTGVEVLEEATVVDIDHAGPRTTSYAPINERMGPGPDRDAAGLRDLLGRESRRVAEDPSAILTLTAGRDSLLVASCLHAAGGDIPTLTMGPRDHPDVTGARVAARRLGWEHRQVWRSDEDDPAPRFDRAIVAARWGEGLRTASDVVGPPLAWPDDIGQRSLLSGSGGELGRAFYWHDAPPGADPVEVLAVGRAGRLPPHVRAPFTERIRQTVGAAEASGRRGLDLLDVVYARGRMRKWLPRTGAPAGAVVGAYTSPAVVRSLLDLPREARRTGSVFDEALALDPLGLAQRVRAALGRRRLTGRLLTAVRPPRASHVFAMLPAVVQQLGDRWPVTTEVMGRAWLDGQLATVGRSPAVNRMLWNAIAIEALHRSLDERRS